MRAMVPLLAFLSALGSCVRIVPYEEPAESEPHAVLIVRPDAAQLRDWMQVKQILAGSGEQAPVVTVPGAQAQGTARIRASGLFRFFVRATYRCPKAFQMRVDCRCTTTREFVPSPGHTYVLEQTMFFFDLEAKRICHTTWYEEKPEGLVVLPQP